MIPNEWILVWLSPTIQLNVIDNKKFYFNCSKINKCQWSAIIGLLATPSSNVNIILIIVYALNKQSGCHVIVL